MWVRKPTMIIFTEIHKKNDINDRRILEWDLHSLEFESICTRVISEQNSCIAHSGNVSLRDPDPGNRGPHQHHRKGGGLQTRSLAVQRQNLHPPTQGGIII